MILLVSDPEFRELWARSTGAFDFASTAAQAREKARLPEVEAFLVAEPLPDCSGREFACELRELCPEKRVALLCDPCPNAKAWRDLRNGRRLDFVSAKSVDAKYLPLLRDLLIFGPLRFDREDYMAALVENYAWSAYAKAERLEALLAAAETAPHGESEENFRREVHKIAGSAGGYGHPRVTELCRDMEREMIEEARQGSQEHRWLANARRFCADFQAAFQFPDYGRL